MVIFDSLADERLSQALRSGAVGVLPTDTLYGLVCAADDRAAVGRLYELKGRENKPGTVIAASIDQLVHLGMPRRYLTAVEQFWPGPVSVVVASSLELSYLDLGKFSLAVRIPDDKKLCKLLEQTGPLLSTSANLPGKPPAANIAQAQEYFGNQLDFCVDGGDLSSRLPSTVIRVIDDELQILRQGAFRLDKDGRLSHG